MNLLEKFKKSPPPTTYPLVRDREVCYNVVMSEKKVEFQSAAKDWTLAFTSATYEYGLVTYLISKEDIDAVHQLVQAMFLTRMMFHDIKLLKEFYKELDRYQKRIVREAATKPQTQSNDEILAEEKALMERTPESVAELEAIKKAKK